MKLGAQLFTLRDYTKNEVDIERTLKKVAEIGYHSVQVSAVGPIKPERLRELCDKNGLTIDLTHMPADRILNDTEALIKEHDILGCSYIGLGGMDKKYGDAEWISCFAKDFMEPAKRIAASGKRFLYHNHAHDFQKINGKRVIEYLLEAFPPELLGITLDTYWVQAAGADLTDWIAILKDRIPCVHYKDMIPEGNASVMVPCMEGNINLRKISEQLVKQKSTQYVFVEQDTCKGSPFDCLKLSYDNLMTLDAFKEGEN